MLCLVCREGRSWRVLAPLVQRTLDRLQLDWPNYTVLCGAALRGDQPPLSEHLRQAFKPVGRLVDLRTLWPLKPGRCVSYSLLRKLSRATNLLLYLAFA